MGFVDGEFEGFLLPSRSEIESAVEAGVIVLDANVLLDLYRQPAAAREKALSFLGGLGDRLWIPHQVAREFWRNRLGSLNEARRQDTPLTTVQTEIRAQLNRLSPTASSDPEVDRLRDAVLEQLGQLNEQIQRATGAPLDVDAAVDNPANDPVVGALRSLLEGKVGSRPLDEAAMIQAGLARFKEKTPPGFIDGEKKAAQLPERGTGDYLVWEQTLRYLETLQLNSDFVFVSRDEKPDWRMVVDKRPIGALPALVAEARERVGRRVIIISTPVFYGVLAGLASESDSDAVESLIATSSSEPRLTMGGDWDSESVAELTGRLEEEGFSAQAGAIEIAARAHDGFVARSEVYRLGGFDAERTLRRFTVPVRRIALNLVEEGMLSEAAEVPLAAVYDGPGPATGFTVPESIRAAVATNGMTWLEAAERAARSDPSRWWTTRELVAIVRDRNFRDLTNAQTPEATLRRDLAVRQSTMFEARADGRWRLLDRGESQDGDGSNETV